MITAQVATGDEAYVALMRELAESGPSGETSVAEVWHTVDRGQTWRMLPWRRALRSLVSTAVLARWPPEWINGMWIGDSGLEIEIFEDGGTDSAHDPIWRASWTGTRWRARYVRAYDVDVDGAIVPASLELDLPGITTPPTFGPYR